MIPEGHWLATERLALRPFRSADTDWFAALYGDPEVTEHLGGVRTPAEAAAMLRARALDYYDAHPGLGLWMTTERATGAGIGFHLINHIQGETILQIGYVLLKPAWGKGYATEMAEALMHYGFDRLGLERLAGMTSLGNTASLRVLEKIGLERRGARTFSHPAYAAAGPLAWFEIEAEAWMARHGHVAGRYACVGSAAIGP